MKIFPVLSWRTKLNLSVLNSCQEIGRCVINFSINFRLRVQLWSFKLKVIKPQLFNELNKIKFQLKLCKVFQPELSTLKTLPTCPRSRNTKLKTFISRIVEEKSLCKTCFLSEKFYRLWENFECIGYLSIYGLRKHCGLDGYSKLQSR